MDGEAFFKEHGYYPARPSIVVPKAPKVLSTNAPKGYGLSERLALRGWRAPLHWPVPPAFENPGLVYQVLGHDAYCEQVKAYWEAVANRHVQRAKDAHLKWVVRACLRTFETHVRGFRRQDVSGRKNIGHGGGGLFISASDEIVLPETLQADGRLMNDLQYFLRVYGVPEKQKAAVERLVRAKLAKRWGLV